jgi:hypothetical protein
MALNKEQHRNRHVTLNLALAELFADFLTNTDGDDGYPISDLIAWSYQQTQEPDHEAGVDEGSGGDPP